MHKPVREEISPGKSYLIRLMPEEDIGGRIKEFCLEKKITRAIMVSAVGSAKDVVVRSPKPGGKIPVDVVNLSNVGESLLRGPYEIVGLEGNVFPLGEDIVVHLHIMLADDKGAVWGGHLISGKVWTTLELVIAEIAGRARRVRCELTALNELMESE